MTKGDLIKKYTLLSKDEAKIVFFCVVLLILAMMSFIPDAIYDIRNDYPSNLVNVYCDVVTDVTVGYRSPLHYPNSLNVFWENSTGSTSGKFSVSSRLMKESVLNIETELEGLIGESVVVACSQTSDGVFRIRGIEKDGKVYIDEIETCAASRREGIETLMVSGCVVIIALLFKYLIIFRIIRNETGRDKRSL